MSNKRLGTEFEREMCKFLKDAGWWVHFLSPDATGAQPFDIIAVRNGDVIAADCKTSVSPIFKMDRLEDNQISAFEYWMGHGNGVPVVFIKHNNAIYSIKYSMLKKYGKVDLRREAFWIGGECP